MIGLANYGLTFTVDAPYLLEEGVDINDFPVLVKIPIANTTNLYDVGETGDTIYFESEGETLKHELMEINATYAIAWVKMDLEALSKKVVTLHYGALVDNNYEDKRGVWVNGVNIHHFNGNGNDTMGINNLTPSANVVFGYEYGKHYQGVYVPAGHALAGVESTITIPNTIIVFGLIFKVPAASTPNNFLTGTNASGVLRQYSNTSNPVAGLPTANEASPIEKILSSPNPYNIAYKGRQQEIILFFM